MKLNQLQELIAVSNKGSFRRAARELQVTQPAMSRSIYRLERELGVVLVERRGRGVALTPIGERFVERASAALSELQHAREEISQLQGTGEGCVAACLAAGSAARLLGRVIAPFRSRYPGVVLTLLDVEFASIEHDLRDGRIDTYAGPQPHTRLGDGLIAEFLHDNPQIVICRRGHPLSHSHCVYPLAAAAWAVCGSNDQGAEAETAAIRCDSSIALLATVAGSDLLARIPRDLAALAQSYGLECIELEEAPMGAPAVMIRRRALPLTPAAEYFCDLLRRSSTGSVQ